MHAVK